MFSKSVYRRFILVVIIVFVGLFAAGCAKSGSNASGQSQGNPADSGTSSSQEKSGPTEDIRIAGSAFSPGQVTVAAGTKVVWTNDDNIGHQVHDDNGAFLSEVLGKGSRMEVNYNGAGTYTYHCHVHGNMKGTITVE